MVTCGVTRVPRPTALGSLRYLVGLGLFLVAQSGAVAQNLDPARPETRIPASPTLACEPFSFPQRTQYSLAVDPTNDQILYVGVEQEGFFKSTDGGGSWKRATNGLRAWQRSDGSGLPCYEEFYATVINPVNPDQLCVSLSGSPGTLQLNRNSAVNNGVYCSDDGAASWRQMVSPSMNLAVIRLAVDPTNFQVMYAGVNGGACSNPAPVCEPNTYFNTTGAIYKTVDGGTTWTELDALYSPDMRITGIRVDWSDPNVVIAGTYSKLATGGPGNFGTDQIGVLRSEDGGQTWSASKRGMTGDPREQALLHLDAAPLNASRVYATAASNQSYLSEDGGQTFRRAPRMAAFAFNPSDPRGLHLLGLRGEFIEESLDGGVTWRQKGRTPDFGDPRRGLPTHFAWSHQDANTVFLAGNQASVYRSGDGGATWTMILSPETLPD